MGWNIEESYAGASGGGFLFSLCVEGGFWDSSVMVILGFSGESCGIPLLLFYCIRDGFGCCVLEMARNTTALRSHFV